MVVFDEDRDDQQRMTDRGYVGRDMEVPGLPQGTVWRKRFLVKYVEHGPGQFSGFQGFDERVVIDNVAATDIDEVSPVREQVDGLCISAVGP